MSQILFEYDVSQRWVEYFCYPIYLQLDVKWRLLNKNEWFDWWWVQRATALLLLTDIKIDIESYNYHRHNDYTKIEWKIALNEHRILGKTKRGCELMHWMYLLLLPFFRVQ